jgi:hypothetical protein
LHYQRQKTWKNNKDEAVSKNETTVKNFGYRYRRRRPEKSRATDPLMGLPTQELVIKAIKT